MKRIGWTDEQLQTVTERYLTTPLDEICALTGKSRVAVKRTAKLLKCAGLLKRGWRPKEKRVIPEHLKLPFAAFVLAVKHGYELPSDGFRPLPPSVNADGTERRCGAF
jgi:hypothetical protein